MFVGGFAAVFIAFGASASLIGQLLLHYRYEVNLGAGAVIVVFGLMMLGALRWVPWLARDLRPRPRLQGGNALAALSSVSHSPLAGRRASGRCWAPYSQ